jgi:hypothetical protein
MADAIIRREFELTGGRKIVLNSTSEAPLDCFGEIVAFTPKLRGL